MTNENEQIASKPARKKVKKVIEISSSEDDEDAQTTTVESVKKSKITFTAHVKLGSTKTKASSCAKKSTTTASGPRKPDRDQLLYILEGGEEDSSKMTLKSPEKVLLPVNKTPSRASGTLKESANSNQEEPACSEGKVTVKRVKSGGSTVIVDEDNSISLDLREIEKIVGHSMKDSRMVVVFKNAPPVKSGGKQKDKDQVSNNSGLSPVKTSDAPANNGGTDDAPFHKRRYKDAFDKYFLEETAVCEHNDSLESESSEEEETYMFPIRNSSGRTNKNSHNRKAETKMSVVLNLMDEVTTDLPHWVAHSRPGSNKFWLARLELEDSSAPCTVPKFIEFDEEFNAKTFVDQKFIESLSGVYDSYEAVKNLLYSVDRYESVP